MFFIVLIFFLFFETIDCSFFRLATRTHLALDELRKLQAGVIAELEHEYRRATSTPPTIAGFLRFSLHNDDVTVKFVAHLVLVYLSAIFVFVDGVRNNNSDIMRAGRMAFLPVWFGRHHPYYRQIILHDELDRLRFPKSVLEQAKGIEAVTKCLSDKHEGNTKNW